MTPDQLAVAVGVEAALIAVALGIVVRGRWRESWLFAAYVPVVLTGNVLVTWWPSLFYTPGFWMAKQLVYDGLKLGLAIELAWRTFSAFPGARAGARKLALVVLAITTVAVVGVVPTDSVSSVYLTAVGQLHPRALNGTIWLMAATIGLAQWYRVPVHPFHAAILTSFGAYLAVFSVLLRLLGLYGWTALPYVNAVEPLAYLLLVCFWAYRAWGPETETSLTYAETLRKLRLRTA